MRMSGGRIKSKRTGGAGATDDLGQSHNSTVAVSADRTATIVHGIHTLRPGGNPERVCSRIDPLRLNPFQLHLHVVGCLPPIGRRLRKAPLDDVVESGWGQWRKRRYVGRLGLEDLCDETRLRCCLECPPARRHLVEQRPQCKYVRPRVGRLALDLFGRHVLERSDDRALRRSSAW
jgi:hypothetical protein